MVRDIKTLKESDYYTLPLLEGTVQLTLDTLNNNSDFRFPERPYLAIRMRATAFKHGVATIAISLDEGKEEKVFIKVLQTELKVSCSVDTDRTYLSRHAYYALFSFVQSRGCYDFYQFYWPDFFNPKTGNSKYLKVTKNHTWIKVKRNPKYAFFYKPGQKMITNFRKKQVTPQVAAVSEKDTINHLNDYAIGYCLADTNLCGGHSNHFPFLVSYTGVWKENKNEIKGFHQFLMISDQATAYNYTQMQHKINTISRQMLTLAPIKVPVGHSNGNEALAIRRGNLRTMKKVYALWQQVIPLLEGQPFTHYLYTYGMRYVVGKPKKMDMMPASFSTIIPQLCFLLVDKGDFYELEMRFKVEGKVYVPSLWNPTFFIQAEANPNLYYLLDSITDYQVSRFFSKHNCKFSVLKCHYQPDFKSFVDQLASIYEVKQTSRLKS